MKCRRIGNTIVCGGDPTVEDLAAIEEFRAHVSEMSAYKREHLTRGDTLAEQRSFAGMTTADVAKALGVWESHVEAAENGGDDEMLKRRMVVLYRHRVFGGET